MRRLEQILGLFIFLLVLADVFLAVLYARAHSGVLCNRIARVTWRLFVSCSKFFSPERRRIIMSFCGPIILIAVIAAWAILLTIGAALIIHPELGAAVRANSGDTATDFATALYAGGSSMAIVGAGDFTPHTELFRIFYLFASLVGISVLSLTVTYLMQVYSALQRRNTLGLTIHLAGGETGDAAELIARLGPEGQFITGYTNLAALAAEVIHAKEAHHFYPVLFYFRFIEPYYSVSRFALVSLDTVTLIKSALDDERYTWLKESTAVAELWSGTTHLLTTLLGTFVAAAPAVMQQPADDRTIESWRQRYFAATKRLRQAGIATIADERRGADIYTSLRAQWHNQIIALAPALAYSMEEIDPAGSQADWTRPQQKFDTRLGYAG